MGTDEIAPSFEEPVPHEPMLHEREPDTEPSFQPRKVETVKFRDHSSLPGPSSTIRFRTNAVTSHVFPDSHGQFIIDDEYDDEGNRTLTTRRMETETIGLLALRFVYTLVAVFFTGFLVVFSLQLLLYLVLDLTIELGITSNGDLHVGPAIGVILAFPLFVHGLACALVISVHFVEDTWAGHPLVKRFVFGRFNGVVTEWAALAIFLGVPLTVMVITLFAKIDDWWEITALAWFSCICSFYIVFAAAVVAFENRACVEVTRNRFDDDDDSWHQIIRRAVLLRQRNFYGGKELITYLAKGSIESGQLVERDSNIEVSSRRTHTSLYSKIIAMKWLSTLGLFKDLDEPQLIFTLDDVKNERAFVTANTWNLEAIYCRSNNARYVAVLKGPEALTKAQMRSTLLCALFANAAVILIVSALLVWLGLPGYGVLIVVILVAIFGLYPGLMNSYRIFVMTRDMVIAIDATMTGDKNPVEQGVIDVEKDASEAPQQTQKEFTLSGDESQGIYQIWETYRVTTVTERMCWILLGMETIFLFIWPIYALFSFGNYAIGALFFFIALFSALRTYFNAAIILEETGTLDLVDGERGSRQHWLNMSRLSIIVTKITRSRGLMLWMGILSFFLLTYLGLFAMAVTQQSDTSSDFEFTYLPDFEYQQVNDLPYPTCSFGKGLDALGSPTTDLSDFVFLAVLAYRENNITQGQLDQWFGEGVAFNNQTFVDNYRNSTDGYESPVSYKMITFPAAGNLAMVAIRGTTNAWDALTDAQLWSAAGLFQVLRFMLPAGGVWTPILYRMVNVISWLESSSINRVAFYRETTAFVKYLLESQLFGNVQVTGHSLGGGLSIITGAQTGVSAVAVSGPNAIISRTSFDPPITQDALNTLTFNIIPDRDIVPRFDLVAKLNQKIRCTAPVNEFAACHDGRRTLCEIIYTCGTKNRPALCDCVTDFGYPEPVPKQGVNKTFAEECAALLE